MSAGAGLIVQPRSLVAPPGDVVDVATVRKALPAAPRRLAGRVTSPAPRVSAAAVEPDDRVRHALRNGPLPKADFKRATGLSDYQLQQLVKSRAIVATGVTRGRRYALPGHQAKEAP